ncbi:MAG TPA: site-2 protease family protein [Gemmatimonadaceae bacterium]|nr:site-2 protease family protein [Gemmatimonadaceae bacterium]
MSLARASPPPHAVQPPLDKVQFFALALPVLLFSMVAHEYAHGYAALKQGDPTAQQLGRLTWNPLKHIDPFMTIILPVLTMWQGGFIFGGAKPIPVVPRNYRNFKRGDIIVSLAGIATNLALAVIFTILVPLIGLLGSAIPALALSLSILQVMMLLGVNVNLMLAFFNLLPIPPLDGSHVMKYLLPPAWSLRYQQLGMYGILVLLIMFATGLGRGFVMSWMWPARTLFSLAQVAVDPFMLPTTWMGG